MTRTYETTIDIQQLLEFVETEMRQMGGDLNWRLDLWISEQLQRAYPEVDFVFEYTTANAPTGRVKISVDTDALEEAIQ